MHDVVRPAHPQALRDRLQHYVTRICEAGGRVVEDTTETISGTRISFGVIRCMMGSDQAQRDVTFYLGAAVYKSKEWDFVLESPTADLATNRSQYFVPMLQTFSYKI